MEKPVVRVDKTAAIDDLIKGALENIKHQMSQPIFNHLSRNDHALMARQSILQECKMGHIYLDDMDEKTLFNYLTKNLKIEDERRYR